MKCPNCGFEINPAAELGKLKKTMTPAAIAARQANAQKRWPKKEKDHEN